MGAAPGRFGGLRARTRWRGHVVGVESWEFIYDMHPTKAEVPVVQTRRLRDATAGEQGYTNAWVVYDSLLRERQTHVVSPASSTCNTTSKGTGPEPCDHTYAYSHEAFSSVAVDLVHIAHHSALVAIDGGSASAAAGRVQLVGPAGVPLGEGLHELFVDHLFETGRMT